jgi:hypothetical protein
MQLHTCIIKKSRGGARGECRVGGGGAESGNCCIHSAKLELCGYGPNYRTEFISENLNLNIELNTSERQMNRWVI